MAASHPASFRDRPQDQTGVRALESASEYRISGSRAQRAREHDVRIA
jgi:hypothetical protein